MPRLSRHNLVPMRLVLLLTAYLPLVTGQAFLHTCGLGDRCGEGGCPERTTVVAGECGGHPSLLSGTTDRHHDCAACVLCSHLQKGFAAARTAVLHFAPNGAPCVLTPPAHPATALWISFSRAPPVA